MNVNTGSTIDKFQENGVSYFKLCIACPVCNQEGRNTERAFWKHYNCEGDIYVGDNAFYKCKKCGRSSHVREWGYNCPQHSNSPEEFVKAGSAAIASVMSCAGQMVSACGQQWLLKFMCNLGEW